MLWAKLASALEELMEVHSGIFGREVAYHLLSSLVRIESVSGVFLFQTFLVDNNRYNRIPHTCGAYTWSAAYVNNVITMQHSRKYVTKWWCSWCAEYSLPNIILIHDQMSDVQSCRPHVCALDAKGLIWGLYIYIVYTYVHTCIHTGFC